MMGWSPRSYVQSFMKTVHWFWRRFLKVFTLYEHGSHLSHVTSIMYIMFHYHVPEILHTKWVTVIPGSSFEETMMGWSPRCYIPSFVEISPPVLEKKVFKGFYHIWTCDPDAQFLPYMDMWPSWLHIKFGFDRPSSFREEDVWNSECRWTDGQRRPEHAYTISSPMSLRLRWAKKQVFLWRCSIVQWLEQQHSNPAVMRSRPGPEVLKSFSCSTQLRCILLINDKMQQLLAF